MGRVCLEPITSPRLLKQGPLEGERADLIRCHQEKATKAAQGHATDPGVLIFHVPDQGRNEGPECGPSGKAGLLNHLQEFETFVTPCVPAPFGLRSSAF